MLTLPDISTIDVLLILRLNFRIRAQRIQMAHRYAVRRFMNKTGAMVLDLWKDFTLDRRLEKRRNVLGDSFRLEWRKRRAVRRFEGYLKVSLLSAIVLSCIEF